MTPCCLRQRRRAVIAAFVVSPTGRVDAAQARELAPRYAEIGPALGRAAPLGPLLRIDLPEAEGSAAVAEDSLDLVLEAVRGLAVASEGLDLELLAVRGILVE